MTALASDELYYDTIMSRRASDLARQREVASGRTTLGTFALVAVGQETFAIPVQSLREIVREPEVTTLPGVPRYLPGILQVRGVLLAAIDLACVLGRDKPSTRTHLAVVESPPRLAGLLVDGVLGFREVFADELTTAFGDVDQGEQPVSGATRDLLVLLDVDRLLSDARLVVDIA